MTARSAFHPKTDAFAFDNSWPVDGLELQDIQRYLARERAGIVRALARSGLARLIVRQVHAHRLLDDLLTEGRLTRYGLCGGMAFAALDYYRRGWVLPQGAGPDDHPTPHEMAGRALRNYIWRRLLDSMQSRAARTMLLWSLALHLVPVLGPEWVHARTKQEWKSLKRRLDTGDPWPIGLVGHAGGSFANHQVLALGYDDPGDGTGALSVYDSCCPASAHSIALDFRGRTLQADESCANHGGDTQWSGFFCSNYTPARPPIAVGLSAGLTVTPVSDAGDLSRVTLRFAARNYSFSSCPPLALRIGVGPVGSAGPMADAGGEEEPLPLEPGADRTLVQSITYQEAMGAVRCTARCFLGVVDGVEVWKELPARDRASAGSVTIGPALPAEGLPRPSPAPSS